MQAYELPHLICQSQDLQRIIAWVLEADVVVGLGLYHKTRKNGDSAIAKLSVILLLASTWFKYLSQLAGSFLQSFFRVGFKYL